MKMLDSRRQRPALVKRDRCPHRPTRKCQNLTESQCVEVERSQANENFERSPAHQSHLRGCYAQKKACAHIVAHVHAAVQVRVVRGACRQQQLCHWRPRDKERRDISTDGLHIHVGASGDQRDRGFNVVVLRGEVQQRPIVGGGLRVDVDIHEQQKLKCTLVSMAGGGVRVDAEIHVQWKRSCTLVSALEDLEPRQAHRRGRPRPGRSQSAASLM